MDIVLGMSMTPSMVRIVVVEGETADGVTVDHDEFTVHPGSASAQVVSAILGTRESAAADGHRLTSTGVAWSHPAEAAALRDALADHKIENVMLVSAFLAAVTLAQAVGSMTRHEQTGLLFIEPDTATLAVVSAGDGSIAELVRQPLPLDDDAAVRELTALVAGVDQLESQPGKVLVVGSGVDVAMIKPELQAASPLPVVAPEQSQLALARGAALASAHAPLFAASTQALAYSAVPDIGDEIWVDDPQLVDSRLLDFSVDPVEQERKPFLLTGVALGSLFVVGVVVLAVAMAFSIGAAAPAKPSAGGNVVVPAQRAPTPKRTTEANPKPKPEASPQPTSEPAQPPVPMAQPAPVNVPASPPVAAPTPPLPSILPPIVIPGLPGGPSIEGPWTPRGDGHRHGPRIKIPVKLPGVHGGHWSSGRGRTK